MSKEWPVPAGFDWLVFYDRSSSLRDDLVLHVSFFLLYLLYFLQGHVLLWR